MIVAVAFVTGSERCTGPAVSAVSMRCYSSPVAGIPVHDGSAHGGDTARRACGQNQKYLPHPPFTFGEVVIAVPSF